MRKVLGLVCAAAMLVGCGGGGDDFFGNRNEFEGRWDGWVEGGGNPRERMLIEIRDDGRINGQETVEGDVANLTGHVERDGRFEMRSQLTGTQDVIYRGDMFLESNNRLIGQGTATQGGITVQLDFSLVRESGGGFFAPTAKSPSSTPKPERYAK